MWGTGGIHWRLGSQFFGGNRWPNECQAVEFKDGVLSIISRALGDHRLQFNSSDGGETFGSARIVKGPMEPIFGCEGSILLSHSAESQLDYLLLTTPDDPVLRTRLRMFMSDNGGKDWYSAATLWNGASGYSSMAHVPAESNSTVGILFEVAEHPQIVMEPDAIVFSTLKTPRLH